MDELRLYCTAFASEYEDTHISASTQSILIKKNLIFVAGLLLTVQASFVLFCLLLLGDLETKKVTIGYFHQISTTHTKLFSDFDEIFSVC